MAAGGAPSRASDLYWDINGNFFEGANGSTAAGTWDSATSNWTSDASGVTNTSTWVEGSTAIFSAGSNVTGSYTVTVSGTHTAAGLTVEEGNVTFSGSTLALSTPAVTIAGGTTTINTILSGSAGLTKLGAGTLVLGFANNSAGIYTGATTVSAGTLRGSATTTAGTGTLPLAITNNSTVSMTAPFTAGTILTATYAGSISGSGTVDLVGIRGIGTTGSYIFSGANTYSGQTTATNVGIQLVGASGSLTSGITVTKAFLTLDNTAADNGDRISGSVTMGNGSSFNLIGNAGVNAFESFNDLILLSGGPSTVTVTAAAGTVNPVGATLLGNSLVRTPGGSLLLRGNSVGANGAVGVNGTRLMFANAPTMSGSGSTGTSTVGVLPGVIVQSSGTGAVTANGQLATLATYDTNGIRSLSSAEYTTSLTTNANVAPAANLTASGDVAINAIEFGGASTAAATAGRAITINSGNSLTINSGMIFSNATSASTLSGGGELKFGSGGTGEAIIANYFASSTLPAVGAITIDTPISASSLTKTGSGLLTLGANATTTFTGTTSVNQGTLRVSAISQLGNGVIIGNAPYHGVSTVTGFLGGSLQISGNVNYNIPLTIQGSYVGGIPATNAQASFENVSGDNTWGGDITLEGWEVNAGNQQFNSIGSQAGTLTLNGVIKNGSQGNAGFYTTGGATGLVVLGGASPNTFTALMRPMGGTLVLAKNGALGPSTATNDQLGVLMTAGSARAAIGFQGNVNYTNFEWLGFNGFGSDGNGLMIRNLGGNNTFAGGIAFGSDLTVGSQVNLTKIDVASGSSLNLSGPLAGRSAAARYVTKQGAGDLIISGDNSAAPATFSTIGTGSTLSIDAGGVVLRGTSATTGTLPSGFTNLYVFAGGSLTLDNSQGVNTSRVSGSASISLNGGELKLLGKSGSSVNQALTVGAGSQSTLTVGSQTFDPTNLNLSTMSRAARGTLLVRGVDGVYNTIDTGDAGLGGGGGANPLNILPYAIADTSPGGSGNTFLAVDGLITRPLGEGEYGAISSGSSTLVNASVTSNTSVSSNTTINAVRMKGAGTTLTISGGSTLTMNAGAVYASEATATSISGGTLALGSREGIFTTAASGTMAVGSVITGSNGLTKAGPGTLVLTGANTYSGVTTVNSGVLGVASDSALGSGSIVAVYGGTLRASSTFTLAHDILFGGFNGSSIDVASGATVSFGGLISGNGGSKTGAGTLAMTGSGSITGAMTLSEGRLSIPSASAVTNTLTLGGGELSLAASGNYTQSMVTSTSGTTAGINTPTGVTMTWDGAANNNIISGTGNLVKTGPGTLVLGNQSIQNTYTGNTIVNEGTLSYVQNTSLVTTAGLAFNPTTLVPGYWTLNGGTVRFSSNSTGGTGFSLPNRGVTISAGGGTIDVNTGISVSNLAGLFGAGTFTKAGAGAYNLRIANGGFSGKLVVSAGTLDIDSDASLGTSTAVDALTLAGGTLELNSTVSTATLSSTRGVVLSAASALSTPGGSQTLVIDSVMSGPGSITKTGSGAVKFAGSAANTYTGATTISAGTLQLSKPDNVNAIPHDLVVSSGGTVTWLANEQVANNAAITLASGGTIDLNGFTETVSGFTDNGGTTLLGGGQLIVSGGDLNLGNGTSITSATSLSGNLNYTGTTTAATISGNLTLTNAAPVHTFNIANGSAATDVVISGSILGTQSITKSGAGTVELSGSGSSIQDLLVNAGSVKFTGGSLSGNAIDFAESGGSMSGGIVTFNYNTIIGDGSTNDVTFSQTGGTWNTPALLVARSGTGGTWNVSGTATLNVNTAALQIGGFGVGYFNQSGGTVNVTGSALYVGSPGTGTYNLSGGSLNVTNAAYAGFDSTSTGTISQTGGSATLGSLILGNGSGTTGTYTLSTGDVSVTSGAISVGNSGTGTLNLNGGSLAAGGGNDFIVGISGTGTVNQAGASATIDNALKLGFNSGSSGSYNLTSGTVSSSGQVIGVGGSGTFTQSGGFNIIGIAGSGSLVIGSQSGSSGAYTMSGGAAAAGNIYVGGTSGAAGGAGALTINTGGAFTAGTLKVWAAGTNVANLAGGDLTVSSIDLQSDSSRFNWTSGTLNVTAGGGFTVGSSGILAASTLTLGSGKTLNITNGATIASGATLTLAGGSLSATGLQLDGTLQATATSSMALDTVLGSGGSIIDVGALSTMSYSGTISGSGALTKTGSGALSLAGASANTNAALATVSGGTLQLGKPSGVNAVAGNLTISSGATATWANSEQLADSATLTVNGTADLVNHTESLLALSFATSGGPNINSSVGLSQLNLTDGAGVGAITNTGSGSAQISNAVKVVSTTLNVNTVPGEMQIRIVDATTLNKTGSGRLVLGATNQAIAGVIGTINVNQGTLQAKSNSSTGINSIGTAAVTMANGTTFQGYSMSGFNFANNFVLSGATATISSDRVTSTNTNGVHTYGTLSMGDTALTINGANGFDVAFSGAVTLSGSNATFNTATSGTDLILSGAINGSSGITKSGAAALIITGVGTFAGPVTVSAGTLRVSAGGSIGAGDVTNNGTLDLEKNYTVGNIAGTGTTVVGNGTAMTVTANRYRQAGLTVTASATAAVKQDGTNNGLSDLSALTIAGATNNWQGTLNLNDNDMIFRATAGTVAGALSQITNQVKSGLNLPAGLWNGTGITSAVAAADPDVRTALGVFGNQSGTYANFDGQTVDTATVLVKFTYFGDANVSGVIEADDFAAIDFALSAGGVSGWQWGDFNYDGVIDRDNDYALLIDTYFGQGGALTPEIEAIMARIESVAVPEPGAAGLVVAAAATGAMRRRRRRQKPTGECICQSSTSAGVQR